MSKGSVKGWSSGLSVQIGVPYTGSVGASFHIENFGCRAARADGEAIAARLRAAACVAGDHDAADVVIVNTCSVTAEADREARAFIRRTHRLNPEAKIVATGCYAQRAPEELAELAGVAAVVGNSHKALVPDLALGLAGRSPQELKPSIQSDAEDVRAEARTLQAQSAPVMGGGPNANGFVSLALLSNGDATPLVLADESFAHSFLEETQVAPGAQTRPNLKIQEGCGNRCSFCVIPQTRGGSRSLAEDAVLRQVEGFVAAGGKELVFSGINLGRWGRDLSSGFGEDRQNLAWLVRKILERTELLRLRLSSIEPMDWDAEMIGLMAEFGGPARVAEIESAGGVRGHCRLARHAHLPLQSGSDAVLRRMHRRYRPWHYVEKAHALVRAAGPELTLGADVMVGFPGETDAEFEETMELVRSLPFGYLHLFPFSARPGTKAWALHAAAPVAARAVEERMGALRALTAEKTRAHREQFVGKTLEAITLNTPAAIAARGRTLGMTENFLPVELDGRRAANELVRVRATGLSAEGALMADDALQSRCEKTQCTAG